MLSVRDIETYYGETQVLFGVSLDVRAGEIVALLGPSGAGKTTLLRSILGLTPARRGHIEFGGRDVTRLPTHEIARAGIGWVPDDRRVFPTLTAARNLAIARKRTPYRAFTPEACCDIFPALRHLLPRECENMSGGELQMVSISRSRSGLFPSMMFGFSNVEISCELMGSGTMSSVRPKLSTCSRSLLNASTDHC